MVELLELSGPDDPAQARGVEVLESGGVATAPDRPFALAPEEARFLDPEILKPGVKNVSLDPRTGAVGGTRLQGEARTALGRLLHRYAAHAETFLREVAPEYAPALERRRTSLRPGPVDTRVLSRRKDDRRLHVDAFPSSPVQGRRILRVFTNVDPHGRSRVWEVGEDGIEALAGTFRPSFRDGGLLRRAEERLGLIKGRRTAYDAAMLALHDRAKLDDGWQASALRRRIAFPPGSTWAVFTDAAPHAALSGQHAFEQTWYLPVKAMRDPARSPLRILERVAGRRMV